MSCDYEDGLCAGDVQFTEGTRAGEVTFRRLR